MQHLSKLVNLPRRLARISALSIAILAANASAAPAVFENNVVTIPAVGVMNSDGSAHYYRVTLRLLRMLPSPAFGVDHIEGANAAPDAGLFDPATGQLHLPMVAVGGSNVVAGLRQLAGTSEFEIAEATVGLTSNQAFRQAMNHLDRAFIPALFFSNTTSANAATVATTLAGLRHFEKAWQDFKARYAGTSSDAQWAQYFAAVEADLATARTNLEAAAAALANGAATADTNAAHEALEDFRLVMRDLRGNQGVGYFMDSVTAYHHAMEAIGPATNVAAGGTLTAAQISAIQAALPALQAEMQKMAGADMAALASQYGFGADKAAAAQATLNAQKGNLAALQQALTNNNAAAILSAAQKVKPLFVKFFLAFGDFLSPFKVEMAGMERAYVPALFLTNNAAADEATTQKASAALTAFKAAWQKFATNYPASLQTPLNWTERVNAVNTAISTAETVLQGISAYPANLTAAHEALEGVRNALLQLRGFENYRYITDRLTAYHNAMEPLASLFKDGDFSLSKAQSLLSLLPQAKTMLQALATDLQSLPPEFGFSAEQQQQIAQLAAAQTANLQKLLQAVENFDMATAISAGQQVRPLFVSLFKAFGGIGSAPAN